MCHPSENSWKSRYSFREASSSGEPPEVRRKAGRHGGRRSTPRIMEIFIAHPQSVGETHAAHFATADGGGFVMLRAGLARLVHATLPFLVVTTASRTIRKLHELYRARP